ncbi:MAG: glycosyltransferase [Acidimicrobiales bacterium]|nr:glycosyltransferase [Acidimicrobiales bacterium]
MSKDATTTPHVLFASAELAPMVSVGGLGLAASGLVKELTDQGSNLTVVLPDYGPSIDGFTEVDAWSLPVPPWCGPTLARRGAGPGLPDVILVSAPGIERPHPYNDPSSGIAWPDNTERFFAFSAGVAALCGSPDDGGVEPDVLHLNDWHSSATVGFLADPPPTVLTVHTLGYQGVTDAFWMSRVPHRSWLFSWYDVANPLAAAIRTADRVIAVSPNYAREILTAEAGMGMDHELGAKGTALVGIRNGIDTSIWNPATDPHLPTTYTARTVAKGKAAARDELLARFELDEDGASIIGVVSRLVDQKGIDLLMHTVPYLESMNARVVLLGSGLPDLTAWVRQIAADNPDRVAAQLDAFDEPLAHLIFAGSDLFCMPSRFEPCGLAQMQAMEYGTPTIATSVGGLVDTIVDADVDVAGGTGFLTTTNDLPGLVDAMHRALRAFGSTQRFNRIRRTGMKVDWSWTEPAARHADLYAEVLAEAQNS